jgi:hypothetical protein
MVQKTVVVIFLLILILAGAFVYHLYSRQVTDTAGSTGIIGSQETYTLHGTEIITTTASRSKIANILPNTAWELGDCIIKEGGGKHLPSFHQGGRSWKDEGGDIIASRGITEFDDKNGNHCVIEDIAIPSRPTVILLKSDSDDSTMKLANELMRQFRLFKIKRKE